MGKNGTSFETPEPSIDTWEKLEAATQTSFMDKEKDKPWTEADLVALIGPGRVTAAPTDPVPPQPVQFGLTEAEIAGMPKMGVVPDILGKVASLLAIGGFGIYFLYLGNPVAVLIFIAMFLALPGGVMVYAIVNGFSGALERRYLLKANKNFQRALDFQEAVKSYENKKKEYDAWRSKISDKFWRSLSGVEFENELRKLFQSMGYQAFMTPTTGDGGIDLKLYKDEKLTVVQCKAHNKKISIGVARELSAAIADFGANDAIIACFDGVTKPVMEYIKNKPIRVLDAGGIVELQRQYGTSDR